jgi:uncharacterized protein (TIRG00374 family)
LARQSERRRRLVRAARWIAGLAVAGLACWLLSRDLDWDGVVAALAGADYRWVGLGVLAIVGTFFTRTWRWQALLWNGHVPLRPAMTALLVGQVVNHALPMRSGDVARALWIGPEAGTGASRALGTVAAEKVWDLLALLSCGLILLVWAPLPNWFANSTWGTGWVLLAIVVILWAGLRWQDVLLDWTRRILLHFPAGWGEAVLPRLRRVASGLDSVRQPAVSARAILWTGLTWGLGFAANLAVLTAFGFSSALAALFLHAVLMAGCAVPTPARLGVFEGICVVSLALFGIPRDEALAAGLVLHLVVIGPPLIAAAILAFWQGASSGSRGLDAAA